METFDFGPGPGSGGTPTLFGTEVQVSRLLPQVPSDAENIRRFVRHKMKANLPWLDINPGPKPGEALEALVSVDIITGRRTIFVSPGLLNTLKREYAVDRPDRGSEVALPRVWDALGESEFRYGPRPQMGAYRL